MTNMIHERQDYSPTDEYLARFEAATAATPHSRADVRILEDPFAEREDGPVASPKTVGRGTLQFGFVGNEFVGVRTNPGKVNGASTYDTNDYWMNGANKDLAPKVIGDDEHQK